MKFSLKKLPKSQIEIRFEILPGEFDVSIEETISELAKESEIKGFRRGKTPKEIILKQVGKEKVLILATEKAIQKTYFKVLNDNKIEAISQPEIEILSKPDLDKSLTFRAKFPVLPQLELPDYRKIAEGTKRKKISAQEKEIENSLLWLQKSRAKFVFKNAPAQKKDFVEIEFSSPQIEGNKKRKDSFILGEGRFIEGFEENLLGMSAGEEKKFSLDFPQDYFKKDLAGRKVDFQVEMKSVQRIILSEISDQFARSLGHFENLNDLRKSIKEGLKSEKEKRESQRLRAEILEEISKKTQAELPDILIQEEKKRMLESFKKLISERFKTSFEDYLTRAQKTEKELLDTFSAGAEREIKSSLVLREIAKQEKIEVPEVEVQTAIKEILNNYPSVKKAEKDLDFEKLKNYYESVIRNEKTLEFLEGLAIRD